MWRVIVIMLLLVSIDGRPNKETTKQEVGEEVVELIVPAPKKLGVKKYGYSGVEFLQDVAFWLPEEYLEITLNRSTVSSPLMPRRIK